MGVITRFVVGLLLIGLAQVILGITLFNESYVFANPGMATPAAHSLADWWGVARSHSDALIENVWPLAIWSNPLGRGFACLFCFPPLMIVLWQRSGRLPLIVLAMLAVLLAVDVHNLFSFNGNNSANGGYDGADDFLCYALHLLLGLVCVGYTSMRCLWAAANILADRLLAVCSDRQTKA